VVDPASHPAGWLLACLVALPLAVAASSPLLGRLAAVRRRPWLPAVATAALAFAGFGCLGASGAAPGFRIPWIPALGIDLALRLDGLALLFTLLVTGIGLAILVFSIHYLPRDLFLHGSERAPSSFYALVLFFMGAMLGLVCADELITLYLFWEATSVSSFLLIGLHLHEARPRDAALQAFAITTAPGLLLFVAFVAIGHVAGTTELAPLRAPGIHLADGPLAGVIVAGVVLGAAAKSALVPFHIWLPNAMVAPTPVSAYLHSATMVAAGVFLLARLAPVLAPMQGWGGALVALGVVTMIAGGVVASGRHELKEILAWSTISQYGSATLLLGLEAWGPALFLIANHAVIKAGLFLVAGTVTHATGESDMRRLGTLWRQLPFTTATAAILSLGLAGLPVASGFWMKELLYAAVRETRVPWIETAALTAGVLTFVYMLRFFWRTFVRGAEPPRVDPDRKHLSLLLPMVGLGLVAVVAGVAPAAAAALTDPAASAAAGAAVETHFRLAWPPSPSMEMSLATFALGAALFRWADNRERQLAAEGAGPFPHPPRPALPAGVLAAAVVRELGPSRAWERALPALDALGAFVARPQTGKLVHYVLYFAAVPVALMTILLPRVENWPEVPALDELDQAWLALATLALAAVGLAVGSAVVRTHIGAILMVGSVGFVLALIFTMLRAPDVALVQVAVETVGALLLLIVLSRIRITVREASMSPQGMRPRAARIATVVAAAMVAIGVAATSLALQANLGPDSLGAAFFSLSRELEIGAVVTAVLVEFRGLDTFGEITVFFAAVLGAVLLLGRYGRE